MRRLKVALGVLSGVMAVVTAAAPLYLDQRTAVAMGSGYLGYFVANYFGYGIVLLPILVKTLDPVLLILVGTLGFTVDEVFAWYAGRVSGEGESPRTLHARVRGFVERRGVQAVFVLGLLPLPGIVYAASAAAAGHFGISLYAFFAANFLGKLIRTTAATVAVIVIL